MLPVIMWPKSNDDYDASAEEDRRKLENASKLTYFSTTLFLYASAVINWNFCVSLAG